MQQAASVALLHRHGALSGLGNVDPLWDKVQLYIDAESGTIGNADAEDISGYKREITYGAGVTVEDTSGLGVGFNKGIQFSTGEDIFVYGFNGGLWPEDGEAFLAEYTFYTTTTPASANVEMGMYNTSKSDRSWQCRDDGSGKMVVDLSTNGTGSTHQMNDGGSGDADFSQNTLHEAAFGHDGSGNWYAWLDGVRYDTGAETNVRKAFDEFRMRVESGYLFRARITKGTGALRYGTSDYTAFGVWMKTGVFPAASDFNSNVIFLFNGDGTEDGQDAIDHSNVGRTISYSDAAVVLKAAKAIPGLWANAGLRGLELPQGGGNINVPDANDLSPGVTGAMTIFVRFKYDAVVNGGTSNIILKWFHASTNEREYAFQIRDDQGGGARAPFQTWSTDGTSSAGSSKAGSNYTLVVGRWYELAFVFRSGEIATKLNGSEVLSDSETISNMNNEGAPLTFGGFTSSGSPNDDLVIQEIRIETGDVTGSGDYAPSDRPWATS